MNDNTPYSVTGVTPNGDGTSEVTVENGGKKRTCAVSSRLLTVHRISVGDELDGDGMRLLSELVQVTRAIKKGISLLSYSDTSCARMAQKLREKGFEKEISQSAAAYLQQAGYINEEQYAMRIASAAVKDARGPLAIRERLRSKGIERRCIEQTMAEICERTDFAQVLYEYARKKDIIQLLLQPTTPEGKKAISSVLRRGFTFEHVSELKHRKGQE